MVSSRRFGMSREKKHQTCVPLMCRPSSGRLHNTHSTPSTSSSARLSLGSIFFSSASNLCSRRIVLGAFIVILDQSCGDRLQRFAVSLFLVGGLSPRNERNRVGNCL